MSTVDTAKYEALAYGSPVGVELAKRVEGRWPEWVRIVGDSWQGLPREEVARGIYVTCVWSLGWLRRTVDEAVEDVKDLHRRMARKEQALLMREVTPKCARALAPGPRGVDDMLFKLDEWLEHLCRNS